MNQIDKTRAPWAVLKLWWWSVNLQVDTQHKTLYSTIDLSTGFLRLQFPFIVQHK